MRFVLASALLALAAFSSANAQKSATAAPERRASDWWAAGTSKDGDVTFLDANSLVRRGPTAIAVTYTVFDSPDGNLKSYVARQMFLCSMRKVRRLKTTFFDVAGKEISTELNSPLQDAPPGSFFEDVLKFACGPVSARASAVQVGSFDLNGLNSAAKIISRSVKR